MITSCKANKSNICRNAEEMKFLDGKPKTSHTTNKVPFVMANAPKGWTLKKTDGERTHVE
jgi:bisphosphoglycerate-independent phosphoglycerate mutase (AlkP superfamily)